jgi:exonuclease III
MIILWIGRRKAKFKNQETMYILGTNAAGILNKLDSFEHLISKFKPGVFFIQESKTGRKNKVNVSDYVVFEHLRSKSGGGGLLTAVHKNLSPVSIGNEENEEILTVQAKIMDKKVRFINAYGPQETEIDETRITFFNKLDEEIKSAQLAGSMICIEMYANSKLGSDLNPGDPNPQSKNGKLEII